MKVGKAERAELMAGGLFARGGQPVPLLQLRHLHCGAPGGLNGGGGGGVSGVGVGGGEFSCKHLLPALLSGHRARLVHLRPHLRLPPW